ncbi:MAG: SusC/RagA family TonB-linked outer membrane protein, partial [Bacteroidota bacterium]
NKLTMRVRAICTVLPFFIRGRSVSGIQKKNRRLPVILVLVVGLTMIASVSFGQKPAVPASEEVITIKGTILDSSGNRLTGVTVQVNGAKRTTTTNNNGEFQLPGVKKGSFLTLSMVGFKTVQVKASEIVSVSLTESATKLDEVVVTGFQKIDRKKFTGASVTLKAADIKIDGVTDISRMLEGRAAGVSVQNVSGTFGTAPKLRIRGATSINGENKPLWVVDGVVLEDIVNVSNEQLSSGDASTLLGSSVAGLNVNDIETFDILKDASAAALYGARAMNGVIVITTKKGKSGKPVISYTGNFGVQLKPSYANYDVMNSADQTSLNAELERKGMLFYPQLVNARNTGIYGELAKLLQYPDANGNFAVQNTQAGRQAWLMKYANANTDWFNLLFKNSVTQQHSLSISSGSDKSQSYFSTSFHTDPGWTIADKVKDYIINARQNYNVSKKLSFEFLVSGNVRQQRTSGTENRNSDPVIGSFSRDFDINPFSYSLNTSRTLPAYNSDGSYNYATKDFAPFNILYETQNNYTNLNLLDGRLQGNLSYKISPFLTYDFRGGLRYAKTTEEHKVLDNANAANAYRVGDPNQPGYNSILNQSNPFLYQDPSLPFAQAISILPYGGFYKRTDRTLSSYTFRNNLTFAKNFNDREHQITALIGQEYISTDRQTANDVGVGYQYNTGGTPFVDYRFFKKMVETSNTYYGVFPEYDRSVAFYGNVQYTYKDRYTIMGTARTDGSNRLGANSGARWLPTWTVAGVWNTDQESFMKDMNKNIISHLLFKASYGLNASIGNAINSTTILQSLITYRQNLSDQQTAINIRHLQNLDLTWEKKYELNAGTDIGFLNERMGLTVDYYRRRSFDLIGLVRTAGIGGEVNQFANYADMKSHGLDISLTGKIVAEKNWGITSTLNFGFNITNITNLKSTPNILALVGEGGGAQQGYPVRGLFSLRNKGLDPTWGYPLYVNDSGFVSPQNNLQSLNTSHLQYEGPSDPTITGGWFNTFRYKNISVNVLLTYQAGNKIRLTPIYGSGYSDLDALPNEFKKRFELPGDDKLTNIPSVLMYQPTGYNLQQQSAFPYNNYNFSHDRVADGGFVRLKAVTLNYQVPVSLISRIGFKSGSLSVTGNNLWLIYSDKRLHGQDPEFFNTGGVALPVNKQITLSLKVGI